MTELKNGEWKAPFWGKSHNVITGRDPLGMQSSSVATYTRLLPGITNLTRRIRYYGFYCWLIEHFRKAPSEWNQLGFTNYIRRSELLFAYINRFREDLPGIPGAEYVGNNPTTDEQNNILSEGADYKPSKTYWKLKSGAFGQYYVGSMLSLGLIYNHDNIFSIKDYGKELADIFEKHFEKNTKARFFECVKSRNVNITDIKFLEKDLSVLNIPVEEQDFYYRLLKAFDHGFAEQRFYSHLRKRTIAFILHNKISGNINDIEDIPKLAYMNKGKNEDSEIDEVISGWYYYQLNEYCHFALEAVFWGILNELKIRTKEQLTELINECVEEVYNSSFFDKNMLDILTEIDEEKHQERMKEIEAKIKLQIRRGESFLVMSTGLEMLFNVYKQNVNYLQFLKPVAEKLRIRRDGDCLDLLDYLNNVSGLPLKDLVYKIIQRFIINRHMLVAYRKMGSTSQNTLKYHIENNEIWFRGLIEPVWTTPRLRTLNQILEDLMILNPDTKQVNKDSNFLIGLYD